MRGNYASVGGEGREYAFLNAVHGAHCDFDFGSLEINNFTVDVWDEITKKYIVYAVDNVDYSGRPVTCPVLLPPRMKYAGASSFVSFNIVLASS